jgi:2-C-methyl-D-erythritol 4-phosphate cytidylyltransferase
VVALAVLDQAALEGLPAALAGLPADAVVLVHDAAGSPAPDATLRAVVAALEEGDADAVVAVAPVTDTIKRVDADGRITATLDRSGLAEPRTPQAYRAGAMAAALERAAPGALRDAWAVGDHGLLPDLVAGRVRVVDLPPVSGP